MGLQGMMSTLATSPRLMMMRGMRYGPAPTIARARAGWMRSTGDTPGSPGGTPETPGSTPGFSAMPIARVLILVGSYAAVAASVFSNEEPVDDPANERTVALLDNRSRNYSISSREVAGFYEKGVHSDEGEERIEQSTLLRWRASESVHNRNLVRCRGTGVELRENYELRGALGSGAFATVSYAVDRVTGFPRAVKTVRTSASMGEEGEEGVGREAEMERMLTEVKSLMELTHPNIVRLFEYYRDTDALYLVEEYCSGGTLESLLKTRAGKLSANECALLLRQMLRGVLCCHAHGLTHRDLKPENFVLASREPSAALKLIDFGLSLNTTWSHVPTEYAHMAGTLEFSAPETFPSRASDGSRTRSRYGQAADVWSCGAIFYQLLVIATDCDRLRRIAADCDKSD